MRILTIKDILRATGGELVSKTSGSAGLEITGITRDSREVGEGVLFIPLKGERADGHDFVKSALEHGASAALTERDIDRVSGTLIRVPDTRRAMGDIAKYYKRKYPVPVIAVTGSVGKTTTKDMLAGVLGAKYNTLKTPNNFNNDIGVPLTLYGIEAEHEAAVVEMGMNHFGEISRLADIVKPDIAVITNIGMSHIENLGSREGIFKAKMEITEGFTEKNTLIVNGGDDFLKTIFDKPYRVIKYGLTPENDIYAEDIENRGLYGSEFTVVHGGGRFRAEVTQPGLHNVLNALAAIAAGLAMGLTEAECAGGLRDCEYTAARLEIIEHNGIEIINDCYNSSPDSVRAALGVQRNSLKPKKAAVLGDIFELGGFAEKAHFELGADVAKSGIDMLVTAGENAERIALGARRAGLADIHSYKTAAEAAERIGSLVGGGWSVLVKASRGMRFERITEALMNI